MTNTDTKQDELLEEIEKLIPRTYCPAGCDGHGTYPESDGQEPVPAQCQWCYEVVMPLREAIQQYATTLAERKVREANRNLIIQLIDGRSDLLLCETCASRKGSRIGGAAMTSWNCGRCKAGQSSGSTAHESICLGCAITTRKCRWCNFHSNQIEATLKEKNNE